MKTEENPDAASVATTTGHESVPTPLGLVAATHWARLANHLIDRSVVIGLVLVVCSFFGAWLQPIANLNDLNIGGPECIAAAVVSFGYYSLAEGFAGRTLGKFFTATKVVDLEGNQPTWRTIVLRTLCRLIPFESLSFLGGTARGLHDSLTGTRVVNGR